MSLSSPPVISRPRNVYGRRRDTSELDTSLDAANISIESRSDSHTSTSPALEHDFPPSSDDIDASNASPLGAHAADAVSDDDGGDAYDGPSQFQFSWREKLKDIDEGKLDNAIERGAQLPHADTEGQAAVATRPASPAEQGTRAVFSGTLPLLTDTSQSSFEVVPARVHRRIETLPPSDSDSELEGRPSTPQSPPEHTIHTPNTRSSPTPPTSLEMPPKNGKGKQRAVNPLPMEDEGELPSASVTANRRQRNTKPNGAKRVKARGIIAPTKKESLETQKTTARITANQEVEVTRAPQKRWTVTDLLSRINAPPVIADAKARPRSRSPLPSSSTSDPIQGFSSPPAVRTSRNRTRRSPSPRHPTNKEFVPTGLLGNSKLDESESEDELPDASALMREAQERRAQEERAKQLKALKARAAAQQRRTSVGPDEDEDDDLLVVDDMESVVRNEARTRQKAASDGVFLSHGKQKQLGFAGRSVRPSGTAQQVVDGDHAVQLLKTAARASFMAGESKTDAPKVEPATLNKVLLCLSSAQAKKAIAAKEEDWKRRGGKIKEQVEKREASKTAQELLQEIEARHRSTEDSRNEDVDMAHSSDDDSDYKPHGDDAGSLQSEEEVDVNPAPVPARGDLSDQADDEGDDENPFVAPRARRSTGPARHRPVARVVSDDEEDSENVPPPPNRALLRGTSSLPRSNPSLPDSDTEPRVLARRSSVSSMGERTEDGTDKENDARLSFDRGEDKENTAIAVQSPNLSLGMGRSFGSLFAAEFEASPAARNGPEGVRSPLKELRADEEDEADPFAFSPGPLRLSPSAPAPALASAAPSMDLDLGETGLQPAFTPSGKGKERARDSSPSPAVDMIPAAGGGGGFSQFFTQGGGGGDFEKLRAAQRDDDDLLTAEPGLQPALEVDQSLAKKADEIFEKEQEFVLQAQQQARPLPKQEVYIDENGFLTQTRPEFRSPLRLLTPGQPVGSLRMHSPTTLLSSVRKPLAPLLTKSPDDDDDGDLPRLRLRKRDRTPSPQRSIPSVSKPKDAFEALLRRPASPKAKKPVRSEFIEGEAEESDDDAGFGFGERRKDDGDEDEDGEEQDGILAELVDDQAMDEETLAENAVREKAREHLEADDKALEQLHMDAARGKLREKRKNRGLGLDDSDDEESDEEARRIRAKIKKQRRDNDSIAALAKNDETRAFAQEYSANMDDDENEFAHLKEDNMDLDVPEPASDEERGVVSAAQLREEIREAAEREESMKTFNPEDVSWMERDADSQDESDTELQVRVKEAMTTSSARTYTDDDGAQDEKKKDVEEMPERLAKWAKSEGAASRTAAGLGRHIGGSAAVTGHGKSKAGTDTGSGQGSGSFKASRPSGSRTGSQSASTAGKTGTKVGKTRSALSAVSDRRSRFGS
ncbi:hypothetical protein BD413DRAFT_469485 [Trametes elegans]|nr:hypothetical protein BD413DRAFT_469485 [Trametes elegans]